MDKNKYILREHVPGDMGWIIHRHGILYYQEYGWNEEFEALVAKIASEFITQFQPNWERCWIAEQDKKIVGSVFLVKKSEDTAQLRMLYVEPSARGFGLGKHLVDECTNFARAKGYKKIVLWTNDVLHSARKLYEVAGYKLIKEESFDGFGKKGLVSQTWQLIL